MTDHSPESAPLLIHYHVFKNAGTSFEWALEQALAERFRSLDSSSSRGFVAAQELANFVSEHPEVSAISSHQAAPPPPRVPGRKVFTSILIRDPLARIRSIYAFERVQEAASPGATKAKELDFKAYVEWRLQTSPAMFCNYQVHFCTRSEEPRRRPIGREELEKAIAHLDAISIVGTVARYDDWIALAQKILSRPFPNFVLQSSRRNVTAAQRSEPAILDQLMDDLGESTTNFLLEHNQLDMCLHQIADSILTRRMAEEGVELMLARAYTRARQNRRSGREEIAHPLS